MARNKNSGKKIGIGFASVLFGLGIIIGLVYLILFIIKAGPFSEEDNKSIGTGPQPVGGGTGPPAN